MVNTKRLFIVPLRVPRALVGMGVFFVLTLLVPLSLSAHPHVFIDSSFTFVGKNGAPSAIKVEWRFDEIFSQSIFDDFPKPASGVYTGKGLAELKDGAFDNLKEYGFFATLKIDGKKKPVSAVNDFSAHIDRGWVIYGFTIPLGSLSVTSRVSMSFFDESFYVSFGHLAHDQVQVEGLPKEAKLVFGAQTLKSEGFGPMQVDEVSLVPGGK